MPLVMLCIRLHSFHSLLVSEETRPNQPSPLNAPWVTPLTLASDVRPIPTDQAELHEPPIHTTGEQDRQRAGVFP